jgi:peptidoglycan/xylan/chitin deacetylase (PgdA/CDA1 family)
MNDLSIAAGATAALLVLSGYHAMSPQSQVYGRTFVGNRGVNRPQRREIALTFDDGPNDPYTFQLLEILAQRQVKATFFMIGKYVDRRPDIARAVVDQGHAIGNHTYTHPNLIFQSRWQLRDEISRCDRALRDAIGDRRTKLFRPPFGARRPATLRTVRAMSLTPVMWNVTGFDWNAQSSESIERHVTTKISGGDVVLLHDGGHLRFGTDRSFTVQATERVIDRHLGEGYQFVTIPEMMETGEQ